MGGPVHLRAALLLAAALVAVGCGERADPSLPTTSAPATVADRVAAHMLTRSARRATIDHPRRYWYRTMLILPAGGSTCAVSSITAGAHGPLVTDAVYDASGTVTVRVRSSDADRRRCLAAAQAALEGFRADGGAGGG